MVSEIKSLFGAFFPTKMAAEWEIAHWDSRLRTPESGGFTGESASHCGIELLN